MSTEKVFLNEERTVIELSGPDSQNFLQNLITNDVNIENDTLIYSALLTPQGKYLFDFFVLKRAWDNFLIDINSTFSCSFIKRLIVYRLRSNVKMEKTNFKVFLGFENKPKDAFIDPRCIEMGWRLYLTPQVQDLKYEKFDKNIFDFLRVKFCVPESGIELQQEKTFVLEAGFERMSGVSFVKGCYVGQEVTAKMKHRTELKRGLVTVELDNAKTSSYGNKIECGKKIVGTLFTRVGNRGIAYLNYKYQNANLKLGTSNIVKINNY
tara:strand:+ start:379 stop:1176 length:798 start_codon:yes stop_codon:yes gene_type:complete